MNIGKLRRRVTVLTPGGGIDPDTGIVSGAGWTPLGADEPAAIEPLSAREFIASGATQAAVTHRITIRWRADVTAKMRCVDEDGTIYAIEQVLPDKKTGREYLTLVCTQGQEAP
jgi:SPP1 family predicted phage head-tail adaptor